MPTVPFPQFCGKDYTPFSSKADTQKLINLMRERIQSGDGPGEYCLIKTPGLVRAFQPTTTGFRGGLELNDHLYLVSGPTIFDYVITLVDGERVYTSVASYGPMLDDSKPVFMAADNNSLLVVSANTLYAVTAGVFSTPTTPVAPITIVLVRGWWVFVGPINPSQVFFFSTDGLTWDALDFQSAEGAPNNIVAAIVDHEELWLVGNRITQPFTVGSDANTPFIPRADAVIMQGTSAPSSVCALDGSLFWLGKSKNGERLVIRMNGYQPEIVSTFAVNNTLRLLSRVDDAISMPFQLNGHSVLRITFPEANRTLDYDATENDWHEVAGWDSTLGVYVRHRASVIIAAFGKILAGDHSNGWVYELSPDAYLDDDLPIRWLRETPHVIKDNKRLNVSRLEVFGETGNGLSVVSTAAGYDPMITMQTSNDGGKAWSNEQSRSMGKIGEYAKRMVWNRLGSARDRVYRFYGDSPTKVCFTGASFDGELSDS